VYRNAGNNQELYKGTFDVLAVGEVVAIFPEGTPNLFDNDTGTWSATYLKWDIAGTSYTEPRIMQVKDGVSWTALEYFKWLQTPEGLECKERDLVVVPCSIVYTDKSRYRSSAVVEYVGISFVGDLSSYSPCVRICSTNRYGQPIHVADYAAEFLSGAEGAEKTTVKRLTKEIGSQLVEMTINAPNWFIPFVTNPQSFAS